MSIDETLSRSSTIQEISWKAERTKSHVLAKHPNRCYLTPLHDKSKSNQAPELARSRDYFTGIEVGGGYLAGVRYLREKSK